MDKIKKVFSSRSKHGETNVEQPTTTQDTTTAPSSTLAAESDHAAAPGLGTGNNVPQQALHDDRASTKSIKSGLMSHDDVPHPSTTGTTPGVSSTLPDRTLGTESSPSSPQHPTFTGERLDPEDQAASDNIKSYHEHNVGSSATGTLNSPGSRAADDSQRKGSLLGFLHGGDPKAQTKYDDGNDALTAKEKYYGATTTGAGTTAAAAAPMPHETQTAAATPVVQHSSAPLMPADTTRVVGGNGYSTYETSAPVAASTLPARAEPATVEPVRAEPVRVEPVRAEPARAEPAHSTFVKPGHNHEHHIGVDGPIGRENEVSGLTTDGRHTVGAGGVPSELATSGFKPQERELDLRERQASLPTGTVIEPRTGLPMNVAKYGAGHGGTDASPQVHGFEENTNRERLGSIADERSKTTGVPTWNTIKENN